MNDDGTNLLRLTNDPLPDFQPAYSPDGKKATSTPTPLPPGLTEGGEVIEDGRLRTTPEAFRRRFTSEQTMRITIEA
jgi:hypothetical protein